jgi:hypothetical protein
MLIQKSHEKEIFSSDNIIGNDKKTVGSAMILQEN